MGHRSEAALAGVWREGVRGIGQGEFAHPAPHEQPSGWEERVTERRKGWRLTNANTLWNVLSPCLSLLQKDRAMAVSQTEVPVGDVSTTGSEGSAAPLLETDEGRDLHPVHRGALNAFRIRLLCIDEKYETR